MGRDKLGVLRAVALQHGWLDANAELADDAAIAAALRGGDDGDDYEQPKGLGLSEYPVLNLDPS